MAPLDSSTLIPACSTLRSIMHHVRRVFLLSSAIFLNCDSSAGLVQIVNVSWLRSEIGFMLNDQ